MEHEVVEPTPKDPICEKCGAKDKCITPFMPGFVVRDGEGIQTMEPEGSPKGGWIVVIGDMPSDKADESGSHWSNGSEIKLLYKMFKQAGEEHRLFYVPGFRCRPNGVNRETGEIEAEKVTKPGLKRCFGHFIEPYIAKLDVAAIIALGPVGCYAAVGRLDYWNLVGRAYRYGPKETPVYAAWHRDHINLNPERLGPEWVEQITTIIGQIGEGTMARQEHIVRDYVLGMRPETIRDWFAKMAGSRWPLSWDIESRGLDKWRPGFKVGVFSFDHPKNELPLIVVTDFADAEKMFKRECPDLVERGITWAMQRPKLEAEIKKVLEDETIRKIGHNLQFDENAVAGYYGWEVRGFFGDTFMWQWALNPDEKGFLGLESLIRLHFPDIPEYWRELDDWKKVNSELGVEVNDYTSIPEHIVLPYAAYDTKVVTRIFRKLWKMLDDAPGGYFMKRSDGQADDSPWTESAYETYSLRDYLLHVRKLHHELCTHLERVGQCVDHELVARVHKFYTDEHSRLEKQLASDPTLAQFEADTLPGIVSKASDQAKALRRGEPITINWSSTRQQAAFFINHLKLPILRKTEKGAPCLDESVIGEYFTTEWVEVIANGQKVAKESLKRLDPDVHRPWTCEVAGRLQEWRKADKFIKSFLDPILTGRIIHGDGMVHCQYRSNGVATGRLGASAPNMQALPRDGLIKKLYRPHDNNGWMITRDYSGLEVRILALFCRDPLLLKTFREGGDVHFLTQSHFFGADADKKNKTQRSICKQALFGNIYGQGDRGLYDLLTENRVINPKTNLPVTMEDCHEFNEMIYSLYTHVSLWVNDSHAAGARNKWIASAFGFIRQLPEFQDFKYYKRCLETMTREERNRHKSFKHLGAKISQAKRRAQNSSIQSTASDLTVIAAHKINAEYRKQGLGSRVVNVIHDDIWTTVRDKSEVIETARIKAWHMDNAKDWLPDYLPGYDASWIDCPVIGECDIGLNPRDVFSVTKEPTIDRSFNGLTVKFGEKDGQVVYKDFIKDYDEVLEALTLKKMVIA